MNNVADMKEAFKANALANKMQAAATFAKPYKDIKTGKVAQRTIADIMSESLDYTDGPQLSEVFEVFMLVVRGEVPTGKAKGLFDRMAKAYALHNAPTNSLDPEDNRSDEVEMEGV